MSTHGADPYGAVAYNVRTAPLVYVTLPGLTAKPLTTKIQHAQVKTWGLTVHANMLQCTEAMCKVLVSPIDNNEGDKCTARTAWCTARAPRFGFYQPFPAFFTFFQGGKDAVA